jgi:hypothetical protein
LDYPANFINEEDRKFLIENNILWSIFWNDKTIEREFIGYRIGSDEIKLDDFDENRRIAIDHLKQAITRFRILNPMHELKIEVIEYDYNEKTVATVE